MHKSSINKSKNTNDMSDNYNFYDNAPMGYSLCFESGCASAEHCLRRLAARDLSRKPMSVSVANPLLTDTKGEGACPFFRKAEMVRIAYGFKKAMGKVESGKVAGARAAIMAMTSRRNYYHLFSGDRPISPDVQKSIEHVLQSYGLTAPVEFDRFEWRYRW